MVVGVDIITCMPEMNNQQRKKQYQAKMGKVKNYLWRLD